jgi:hypothetical protein
MIRRATFVIAAFALLLPSCAARAQRASIAAGAAVPIGDFANAASTGYDIQLQARTEPMIGPLSLRIDVGYDGFSGKGAISKLTVSAQSISVVGDINKMFYWVAGPGLYEMPGRQYFGAQVALGMNIPIFRWEGFLEVSGVRFFSPRPITSYVPLRFGIRL